MCASCVAVKMTLKTESAQYFRSNNNKTLISLFYVDKNEQKIQKINKNL